MMQEANGAMVSHLLSRSLSFFFLDKRQRKAH
jgi:hypothetical protein